MEEYLTSEEVAAILKIKPLTVREMFRTQRLRGFKIGKEWRITKAVFDEDLESMQRATASPPPAKRAKKKPVTKTEAPVPEASGEEALPEKPKRRRKEKTESNSAPDSEQQLLF